MREQSCAVRDFAFFREFFVIFRDFRDFRDFPSPAARPSPRPWETSGARWFPPSAMGNQRAPLVSPGLGKLPGSGEGRWASPDPGRLPGSGEGQRGGAGFCVRA